MSKKKVVIGVSAGIACFKILSLISLLNKKNYDVSVIMTKNATKFISPILFESLSSNKCYVEMFEESREHEIEHIELAKKTDLFILAPASANIIAKISNGIADDFLTTYILALKCDKIICPSMNTRMYENSIVSANIKKLKEHGFDVMPAVSGKLACKDEGMGKLPDILDIYDRIEYHLETKKDFINKRVLISAGPTKESIDPVRFITNHSSGKMGIELAKALYNRGANVKLVLGDVKERVPKGIEVINVVSANDMFLAMKENFKEADIIIKTAAVSDYRPIKISENKIKKVENLEIKLEKTVDILKYLGENKKEKQILCGFSMETENLIKNSKKKLEEKNLDLIVANNIKDEGAGFLHDTNKATIIKKDAILDLKLMTKKELANIILDEVNILED